jgi:ATP-dependent protease ClpP protease subunit
MIGNIYITGQIGSSDDTKGVELVDVALQVEPLKECEQINCYINSPGGSVEVGKQIAQYLKSLPNVHTIATGLCASIATEIHLAVPLANRKIVEGTEYMIHNPLFDGIGKANVNDLKEMVDVLEPLSKEMVAMYSTATGTSKDAISALMDIEASLTNEQLVTLGFVSEVIPKLKPLAFINTNDTMKKETIKLGLFAKAMAKLQGREIKAIMEDVAQGAIETPFADLMAGDPIMLDGVEAPIDTYVLADGTQLVVVEAGIISEVIPADATKDNGIEVEVNALKAELETANAEILALKSELETNKGIFAQMETEHNEVLAVMETLKEQKSTFTPPAPSAHFRTPSAPAKSQAELMAEKRANLKTNKK